MILKGKISWVNNSHLGNGTYYTCCCDVRVSPRTPLIWASTSNFHINTLCWMNFHIQHRMLINFPPINHKKLDKRK